MTVPFDVSPDVAVTSPEIVGVAVQAVPVTVRFPPRDVRPVPSNVRVGLVVTFPKVMAVVLAPPATIVDPSKVKVPGVVAAPMVLIDEAPEPNVFVSDEPVPIVDAPEDVRVVKDPAPPEIPAVQANAPVELVTVQPVDPDPPPSKMSPVDVVPRDIVPVPFASTVKLSSVPDEIVESARPPPAAAAVIFKPVTADAVLVST